MWRVNSSVHCSVQMLLLLAILLFICLTSLLSLSVRELSNKHVKFRVVWRNVLDSLFAMPGRLCLASLSRAGVHASFFLKSKEETFLLFPYNPSYRTGSDDDHLAANSYASTLALRGFVWCSKAAPACQTLALCQSSKAGWIALSWSSCLSQWNDFFNLLCGFCVEL